MAEEIESPTAYNNNRQYTHDSLVKQANAAELHFEDGSFRVCGCNAEKHLPRIEVLADEGGRFAKSPEEKKFMRQTGDKAREFKALMKNSLKLDDTEATRIADWAKEVRKRVDSQNWNGPIDMDVSKKPDAIAVETPEPLPPATINNYTPELDRDNGDGTITEGEGIYGSNENPFGAPPSAPPPPPPMPSTFPAGAEGGKLFKFFNRPGPKFGEHGVGEGD